MADDPTVTGDETVRKINSLSHMQLLEYHRIFQPRSFLLNGLCLMGSGMRFPGLLKIYFFIIIISIYFFFFHFWVQTSVKKNKNTGSLSWLVIRTNPRSLGFLSGYFQSAYRVQKWAKAEGNFSAKQFLLSHLDNADAPSPFSSFHHLYSRRTCLGLMLNCCVMG